MKRTVVIAWILLVCIIFIYGFLYVKFPKIFCGGPTEDQENIIIEINNKYSEILHVEYEPCMIGYMNVKFKENPIQENILDSIYIIVYRTSPIAFECLGVINKNNELLFTSHFNENGERYRGDGSEF